MLAAWGIVETGHKVLLHLAPGHEGGYGELHGTSERISRRRGLGRSVSSSTDGAPGSSGRWRRASARLFASGAWPRLRNLRSKAPDRAWARDRHPRSRRLEAASPALATLLRDDFVHAYERELPAVVACFRDDFEACIAHLRFPLQHRKVIRTTNLLERLFLEERRRTKVIPHAFGERPVLKLMYAAVIRAADRWRGITVGEFEQRQLRAIRDELNRAHATRTAPAVTAPKPAAVRKLRN